MMVEHVTPSGKRILLMDPGPMQWGIYLGFETSWVSNPVATIRDCAAGPMLAVGETMAQERNAPRQPKDSEGLRVP
jgi:hypothetical protein